MVLPLADCDLKRCQLNHRPIGSDNLGFVDATRPMNVNKIDPNLVGPAIRRFDTLGQALEAAGAESLSSRWTRRRIISAIRSRNSSNQPTHLMGLGDLRIALAVTATNRFMLAYR